MIHPDLQKIMLAALVLLVGIVHAIISWRLERGGYVNIAFIAASLIATIWVPQAIRDVLLIGLCGLLALVYGPGVIGRLIVAAIIVSILGAIASMIPGGTFTPILCAVAIGCAFGTRTAIRRSRRVARAQALQPNQQATAEVQFGGRVRAQPVRLPAGDTHAVAAWQVALHNKRSEALVELRNDDYGVVLVDPRAATLDVDSADTKQSFSGDEAKELLLTLGVTSQEEQKDTRTDHPAQVDPGAPDPSVVLEWIEQDAEACVIGRPTWQPHASAGSSRGYRDAPVVPVFGKDAVLWDRSEQQLKVEVTWWMWSMTLWSPVVALIATYLLAGPF